MNLGEFVEQWGDEGAKHGWCLFQMDVKDHFAKCKLSNNEI